LSAFEANELSAFSFWIKGTLGYVLRAFFPNYDRGGPTLPSFSFPLIVYLSHNQQVFEAHEILPMSRHCSDALAPLP